ncbi:MAG TPA: dienelactone hydrolase family protein [Burkholderiaceae bacterium]
MPPSSAQPAAALPDCVEMQTSEQPDAAVIWLHGLGADGYDFVPIVREFDALGVPPLRYVFPHAPMRPVTINGGHVMRAWYDIRVADLAQREDPEGIRASQAQVDKLIEREVARGVARGRIVLAGFSQGGAIVLHTAIRQPQPVAGVVALSCYLPLDGTVDAEATAASRATPILMAHGTTDPVVPFERGRRSRERLDALGFQVQWHEYPIQHGLCADEVGDIARFLAGRLRV